MMSKRIGRAAISGAATLAVLALATAAHAEVVTYDFTATIDSADATEIAAVGLPASGELSGSFTYDTEAGWYGGSNMWADPSLDLSIDQMPETRTTSAWLAVEYNQGEFKLHTDGEDSGHSQVGARLKLSGQEAELGSLPTSLAFGGGAGGVLELFIGGDFGDIDTSATITSLSLSGGSSAETPELDPASGSAALVVLFGGAALMMGERRRRLAIEFG